MPAGTFKHSFKLAHHDALGLAVYNCGFQRCDGGYTWGPAVRDHYLIHYITSGKGRYFDGRKEHLLARGDGFLVTPAQKVFYEADSADPWEYYWVGFNGTDAARLLGQAGLSHSNPIFHYGNDSLLRERLLNIYQQNGSSPSAEARMQAALLLFLADLMEHCAVAQDTHKSGYEYVEKSLRFIDYNYSRSISVDDIARNAGISRSHLYRLFMQHISMPPNEYLTRYRVQKAGLLLSTQHLSVGEAAYSTGFSDQLYFSRVFKKYRGVPPSRYAAAAQNNAEEKSGVTCEEEKSRE